MAHGTGSAHSGQSLRQERHLAGHGHLCQHHRATPVTVVAQDRTDHQTVAAGNRQRDFPDEQSAEKRGPQDPRALGNTVGGQCRERDGTEATAHQLPRRVDHRLSSLHIHAEARRPPKPRRLIQLVARNVGKHLHDHRRGEDTHPPERHDRYTKCLRRDARQGLCLSRPPCGRGGYRTEKDGEERRQTPRSKR